MEIETKRLNDVILKQKAEIFEIEKNNASVTEQLKQSKIDLGIFQRRYDDLQKEFSQFKVIKKKIYNNNLDFFLRNALNMF